VAKSPGMTTPPELTTFESITPPPESDPLYTFT
jgi:hypothetical protein